MQEEVENRTLTLVISGTKFTGRLMKAAITKYLAHRKEKKLQKQKSRDTPVIPHGKQTVKQLIGQNQGVSNIEITDPSIKEFEKIARKYGVDYDRYSQRFNCWWSCFAGACPSCYEYDVFRQYRAWGDSIFFSAHLCWCRNLCFFYCGNRQYEASKNSCKHFSYCSFTLHEC